jgi:DNA-binding MurR/RpiR family transcriptional regulator
VNYENVPACIMMLKNMIPRLGKSKQSKHKCAEYITANYRDIMNYNVNEIAKKSGTSPSTVIRLCQDLGFKRYQDFKLSMAQHNE